MLSIAIDTTKVFQSGGHPDHYLCYKSHCLSHNASVSHFLSCIACSTVVFLCVLSCTVSLLKTASHTIVTELFILRYCHFCIAYLYCTIVFLV